MIYGNCLHESYSTLDYLFENDNVLSESLQIKILNEFSIKDIIGKFKELIAKFKDFLVSVVNKLLRNNRIVKVNGKPKVKHYPIAMKSRINLNSNWKNRVEDVQELLLKHVDGINKIITTGLNMKSLEAEQINNLVDDCLKGSKEGIKEKCKIEIGNANSYDNFAKSLFSFEGGKEIDTENVKSYSELNNYMDKYFNLIYEFSNSITNFKKDITSKLDNLDKSLNSINDVDENKKIIISKGISELGLLQKEVNILLNVLINKISSMSADYDKLCDNLYYNDKIGVTDSGD